MILRPNITESPNESAIKMEVVADVYQHQQQTQQQSQRNKQTRPYSNAERQRRYREKRKADIINACTTFSQSSDVQPNKEQPHDVQITERQPHSNAERQRKYRKLLRERDTTTVLSNTPHTSIIYQLQNVDQAELARKRHLNKLRQRRFRARQRLESSSSSSYQAQAKRFETMQTSLPTPSINLSVDTDSKEDLSDMNPASFNHNNNTQSISNCEGNEQESSDDGVEESASLATETKPVQIKAEPEDIPALLEQMGNNYTMSIDIDDPFLITEISDSEYESE